MGDLMNWYGPFPQGTKEKVMKNSNFAILAEAYRKKNRWSRTWKKSTKRFRDAYLSLSASWDILWDRLYNTYRWAHTWKQSAKKFRAMFLEVSLEWEAERDRYHEALKRTKELEENEQLYRRACDKLESRIDEARHWAIDYKQKADNLEAELEDEKNWFQLAVKERDEVVDLFFYNKKKAERQRKTIQKMFVVALKNRRLRNIYTDELEKRIEELEAHIANMDIELEFSNGLSRTRRQ